MSKVLWRSTLGAPASNSNYPDAQFEDSSSHSVPGTPTALPVSLAQDIARSFRQLGVASFRASVVNVDSMTFQAAWTISETGEVTDNHVDRPLDNSFPAATAAINLLAHASDDETLLHKLSPRRWGIAWRLEDPNVVLAEAQFHDRRDSISESDKTLLRLVCSSAMRPLGTQATGLADLSSGMAWPSQEAAVPAPPRLASRLSVVLIGCSLLLAGVVAAVALPEVQRSTAARDANLVRLQDLADNTLVRGLATAMSSGDYGDVQTVLSSFQSLGYFEGAAVVNLRQRVVALAGRTDPLRIGDAVPEDVQRGAQLVDLTLGTERQGQLVVVAAPAAARSTGLPAWLAPVAWAAALTAAGALVAGGLSLRKPAARGPAERP